MAAFGFSSLFSRWWGVLWWV